MTVARDGQEALNILKSHNRSRIDLLLTDDLMSSPVRVLLCTLVKSQSDTVTGGSSNHYKIVSKAPFLLSPQVNGIDPVREMTSTKNGADVPAIGLSHPMPSWLIIYGSEPPSCLFWASLQLRHTVPCSDVRASQPGADL